MVSQKRTSLSLKGFYLFTFFAFGSLFPLLGVYFKEEAGLSGTEIGTLMSLSPIVMIFAQPMWGIITDYTKKPKHVLAVSLLLTGLIGYAVLFIGTYGWLFIILILLALFQSAIVPISDSILLNYVNQTNQEYGNYRLFGAIGFAVAVFIMGKLSEMSGISIIFYSFALSLLLCLLLIRSMPREGELLKVDLLSGLSALIRMPKYMVFLITTFLIFGPIFANNFYFSFYIQGIGGTLTGVGIAFLLAAGSEAPFMKLSGIALRKYGVIQIMMFAAAVSGLRWTFYFFQPSITVVLLTTVVQGFSVGLFIPAAMEYIRENTPSDVRATAVSLYTAVGNGLGSWFCTFLGGIIFDKYSIFNTYLFFGILSFAGLFMIGILMRLQSKDKLGLSSGV
ncbi:MFS transporter [Fictibacillus sp. WQ 8-8]|uniref:MFS transporter n=1 Tax=unclassified Fictibacillus TaxID=2644029 RepID=UPI00210E10F4|nr:MULTISPECIES: MFS transporter [unclassified Fictibacillus]MCQ6266634.1 MFS transporter [Fictibacillus sp. WQ 8-8]MED2971434.1 MFS transporter [Fictibacillus sp. B-59209]